MQYRIRIDGHVAPQTYSYEQLIETGIKEFDDIYVQQIGDSEWHIAKYYDFPEADGGNNPDYEIDEYGQIKRKNLPVETTTTETSSSSSSYSSSSSDGWITFFKVLGTIAIIVLAVVIIGATHGYTAPLAYGAWKGIQAIWED